MVPPSYSRDKFHLPSTNIDDVLKHYCSFPQNFNLISWDADANMTTIAPPPLVGELKMHIIETF